MVVANFSFLNVGFKNCEVKQTSLFNSVNINCKYFFKFATTEELEAYWHLPLSNWLALCDKLTIKKPEAISILAKMPDILAIDPRKKIDYQNNYSWDLNTGLIRYCNGPLVPNC